MDSNFKILYAMSVMLSVDVSDIAIITIKNVYYHCIINNSKSEAINLLKSSVLEDRGYI